MRYSWRFGKFRIWLGPDYSLFASSWLCWKYNLKLTSLPILYTSENFWPLPLELDWNRETRKHSEWEISRDAFIGHWILLKIPVFLDHWPTHSSSALATATRRCRCGRTTRTATHGELRNDDVVWYWMTMGGTAASVIWWYLRNSQANLFWSSTARYNDTRCSQHQKQSTFHDGAGVIPPDFSLTKATAFSP